MNQQEKLNTWKAYVVPFVFVLVGLVELVFGYSILKDGWEERDIYKGLKSRGIHTSAKLAGYKYVYKRSSEGDYPLFEYTAIDGRQRQHVAYEYGVAAEYGKRTLPTQSISITYLPENPEVARILKWRSTQMYMGRLMLGALLALFGMFVLLESAKLIRRITTDSTQ